LSRFLTIVLGLKEDRIGESMKKKHPAIMPFQAKRTRPVLGKIKFPSDIRGENEGGLRGRLKRKEQGVEDKARSREEKLKLLKIMQAPERQVLKPQEKDAIRSIPLSQFVIMLGCIIIMVLGLFTLIYLAQVKNQLGADVSRLEAERKMLRENNGHLKAKLERLVALEDLELIARESLGLSMPKTGQIIILE
jgi:cell division protein FtsB